MNPVVHAYELIQPAVSQHAISFLVDSPTGPTAGPAFAWNVRRSSTGEPPWTAIVGPWEPFLTSNELRILG